MRFLGKEKPILEVANVKRYFIINNGFLKPKSYLKALDGVSFKVNKGETLGIVGESGCGKSTLARVIIRLIEATEGKVFIEGNNIFSLNPYKMKRIRRMVQIIFQDPYASLNPRMTVEKLLGEPLEIHKLCYNNKERLDRIRDIMDVVGLSSNYISRYPHEFSGGQRQRISLARVLILKPELLLCDEPVSALDVSIQAKIINLMEELQKKFNLTYLFISHDLSVVKHISTNVAVMYLGKIMELANSEKLYSDPIHPYTKALLSAIPMIEGKRKGEKIILEGDITSPINPPSGCVFHTRCPIRKDICLNNEPLLSEKRNKHFAACHLNQ